MSGHQRHVHLVGTLLLLCSSTISSHEAGVGRAVVTFPSSRDYAVDLTVDAASLLARLELLAGQPLSGLQTGPECAVRIAGLRQELAKHVVVRVDGVKRPVVVDSAEEAPGTSTSAEYALAPEVRLHMHGQIPEGARSATWQYDLTFARYALVIKGGQGNDESEWLEGGQESRAMNLSDVSGRSWGIRRPGVYAVRALQIVRANAFGCLLTLFAVSAFSRRLRPILWQPTGPTEVRIR